MAACTALFSGKLQAEKTSSPQNILFIAIDDLNDWVGVLGGHPQALTPNIDKLAERGMLFTNAHCTAPGCNASRTSLLMGLRPSTTGIYQNAHDWRETSLVDTAVHLPQHLRTAGTRPSELENFFMPTRSLTPSTFRGSATQKHGTTITLH